MSRAREDRGAVDAAMGVGGDGAVVETAPCVLDDGAALDAARCVRGVMQVESRSRCAS